MWPPLRIANLDCVTVKILNAKANSTAFCILMKQAAGSQHVVDLFFACELLSHWTKDLLMEIEKVH
jgi:hypothetical protein